MDHLALSSPGHNFLIGTYGCWIIKWDGARLWQETLAQRTVLFTHALGEYNLETAGYI